MYGGAWWAIVHGVAKSQTILRDFTFTFHFHALEKEMATHCSVLAWRIPGTGEPGGLPSMGVTLSRARLKRLSSNSSSSIPGRAFVSSVAQSCPTVCDPMNRSTPGLPVHHQLLELTSVTSSARAWWTIAHQAPLRTKELRLLNCGVGEDS